MAGLRDTALRRYEAGLPPGAFVSPGGVPIHYVMRGEGRPVVYIHGAKSPVFDFLLSIADTAASRYTAVAFDRRGAGFSGRADRKSAEAGLRALALRYRDLDIPVVIVVGDQDRVVPPRSSFELQRLLPHAEFMPLAVTGHMPHFTRPDAVMAAVDRAAKLSDPALAAS